MPKQQNADYLYRRLEQQLRDEIERGQRPAGSRMPSIRQLSRERGLSKSTVLSCYDRLEADGLIQARPRSGYFVATDKQRLPAGLKPATTSNPDPRPAPVSAAQVMVDLMDRGAAFDLIVSNESSTERPAAARPDSGNDVLKRTLARAVRHQSAQQQRRYDSTAGLATLRQLLCQRLALGASRVDPDQLLISGGCQNALMLALMACCQPGDIVAVESPGFYGVLQLIEALGLQVLELPSSAEHGLSPEALALALGHWPIKALVVSPSYATPTGACMPDSHKQQILSLCRAQQVAIIEDDIYGELGFGLQRPRTLHSFDDSGSVLLCGSFSKSLSRDLRLGWIAPGRYFERVKKLKLVTSLASSQALQQGLVYFLEAGSYDRHLRIRRQQLQQQYRQLQDLIEQHLPMAERISRPQGGLSLWLEFPDTINTLKLYHQALAQRVILTPGRLFTTQERYLNALRLSFAHPWDAPRVAALSRLGLLLEGQLH